jgi:hypothetical protein
LFFDLQLRLLEQVLDNIVSILVLNKINAVLGDFLGKSHSLIWTCVVDASLENTASMFMSCNLIELIDDLLVDKVALFFFETLESLLNNVVPVMILD